MPRSQDSLFYLKMKE